MPVAVGRTHLRLDILYDAMETVTSFSKIVSFNQMSSLINCLIQIFKETCKLIFLCIFHSIFDNFSPSM